MHAARGSNGFGSNPIGYVDIDAWSRLTGKDVAPIEVTALLRLDRLFLTVMAEPDG